MGLIHISDGKRYRECDEADLPFFERKGYKKTCDVKPEEPKESGEPKEPDKPEEPEKPEEPKEPKKGGKKDDNQNQKK